MKILLLSPNTSTEMMAHSWALAGADVIQLTLPVRAFDDDPGIERETAARIRRAIDEEKPDIVVDINAAGILPLDTAQQQWTPHVADCLWCLWWWDAPHIYAGRWDGVDERLVQWLSTLESPTIHHFFWDDVLASEYSQWFRRPCHWLPTATHPQMFNPAAIDTVAIEPVDVSFLGTFYTDRAKHPDVTAADEIAYLAAARLSNPEKDYRKLIEDTAHGLPGFGGDMARAALMPGGPFWSPLRDWKGHIDHWTGVERRSRVLEFLLGKVGSTCFIGENWPEAFNAQSECVYQPAHLSARYCSSVLNLDLGNGQSFTGTAMRSYEIMSAAGVLVRPHGPDFDPDGSLHGDVYLGFDTEKEIPELYRMLADDIPRRRRIGDNARQYIIENHSWSQRLTDLLAALTPCTEATVQYSCSVT